MSIFSRHSVLKDNSHKRRDPELPVYQKRNVDSRCESNHYSRHQIPNDDQVANCHAKALDRNSRIEYDGEVRIRELRKRSKRDMPAIQISCAASLEV